MLADTVTWFDSSVGMATGCHHTRPATSRCYTKHADTPFWHDEQKK
jgi:hypothetical protein